MENKKIYKLLTVDQRRRLVALALAATPIVGLAGCEYASKYEGRMDTINYIDGVENVLSRGVKQKFSIERYDFDLIVTFSCKNDDWFLDENKDLQIEINTEGLPSDTIVYIDNIHLDSYAYSNKKDYEDLLQDTVDDHVHSSRLVGFYIDDDSYYSGGFKIEMFPNNLTSYHGNRIAIAIDLLVKGPKDDDFTNYTVSTDVAISETPKEEREKQKTYDK